MFDFRQKLRSWTSGMLMRRRVEASDSPGRALDWLPPVLGPDDWAISMMAGRSANWYLDRGQV